MGRGPHLKDSKRAQYIQLHKGFSERQICKKTGCCKTVWRPGNTRFDKRYTSAFVKHSSSAVNALHTQALVDKLNIKFFRQNTILKKLKFGRLSPPNFLFSLLFVNCCSHLCKTDFVNLQVLFSLIYKWSIFFAHDCSHACYLLQQFHCLFVIE